MILFFRSPSLASPPQRKSPFLPSPFQIATLETGWPPDSRLGCAVERGPSSGRNASRVCGFFVEGLARVRGEANNAKRDQLSNQRVRVPAVCGYMPRTRTNRPHQTAGKDPHIPGLQLRCARSSGRHVNVPSHSRGLSSSVFREVFYFSNISKPYTISSTLIIRGYSNYVQPGYINIKQQLT